MMVLVVVYTGAADQRFDVNYYKDYHLPLVRARLGNSLLAAEVLTPTDPPAPFQLITLLRFASATLVDQALRDDVMDELMADIARFTDILPTIQRMQPLLDTLNAL